MPRPADPPQAPRAARTPRTRRALHLLAPLGLISLLDLTTSAIPSFIDVFGPVPSLPLPLRLLEAALALTLLPLLPAALRAARALIRTLPGRTTGKALLALYLIGATTAVLLRTEYYPFSNVGMFSAVPDTVDTRTPRREPTVAFVTGPRFVPLAPLREGMKLGAQVDTDWDYKAGWVIYMFGTSHSQALSHVSDLARANGFEGALRVRAVYDPRTGRDLGVEPYRRTPSKRAPDAK